MPNRTSDQSRPRLRAAVVAMLGGTAAAALSVTAITAADRPGGALTSAGPSTVTLGPEDVTVVRQVYVPGDDSGDGIRTAELR